MTIVGIYDFSLERFSRGYVACSPLRTGPPAQFTGRAHIRILMQAPGKLGIS